jgi:hypothetical protein
MAAGILASMAGDSSEVEDELFEVLISGVRNT